MKNVMKELLFVAVLAFSGAAAAAENTFISKPGVWSPDDPEQAVKDQAAANVICGPCAEEVASRTGRDPASAEVRSTCERLVANGNYGNGRNIRSLGLDH